ncbi:MAG: hypothetical protein V3U76_14380 [Granulosicoccus sp.]
MKNRSFSGGIALALLFALISSVLLLVLSPGLSGVAFIRVLVPILVFAYLIYLNRLRANKTGQVTSLLLWCLFSLTLWLLSPALPGYVLLHTIALWLIRSSYFHRHLTTMAVDLGLSLFALVVAYWTMVYAGSIFLSVWCFFLVQAGFVSITARHSSMANSYMPDITETNNFDSARHKAEQALQQLATR